MARYTYLYTNLLNTKMSFPARNTKDENNGNPPWTKLFFLTCVKMNATQEHSIIIPPPFNGAFYISLY